MTTIDDSNVISVKVMDQVYRVKCPPDEAAKLLESAKYLDAEMRKINSNVQGKSMERLAIIAALNITHELMYYKNQKTTDINVMHEHIKSLQQRIQHFLDVKNEVTA